MTKTGMSWAILIITLAGLSMTGCQKQQTPQDETTYRLIGAENVQLKWENENLRKNIDQLKKTLAKCEEDREKYKHKVDVEIKENVEGILKAAMDENVVMRDKIEVLQAEIAKLKGEAGEQNKPQEGGNEGQSQ